MNITKAAWLSMCRAMRFPQGNKNQLLFHVIGIDDTGAPIEAAWMSEWREKCAAPNLQTLEHVQGNRSISANMRTGFRWAAARTELDLIVNIDSDLLVVADFFGRIRSDYQIVKQSCRTAVTSGYSSALSPRAFGANFVFDLETYRDLVDILIREDPHQWEWAWDEAIGNVHLYACDFWPPRPSSSYAQHVVSTEGLHFERDGHKEVGRGFVWDEFNSALSHQLQPQEHCGAVDGGCNCVGVSQYCNEKNGWCGDTATHKAASTTGKYDCVKSNRSWW